MDVRRHMSVMRGSCWCGAVRFEVSEPFTVASFCHCTSCKRISGGGGTANGRARSEWIEVTQGRRVLHDLSAGRGERENVLLALRLERLRRRLARVGGVQCPTDRDRRRARAPAGVPQLRPVSRSLGNASRRRAPAERGAEHLRPGHVVVLGRCRTSRPGSCSARSPLMLRRGRSPTPWSCSSTRRSSRSGAGRGQGCAPHPGGRRGRGRRDRPGRQVHLPRAWAARLLPDLRPHTAWAGREEVLP